MSDNGRRHEQAACEPLPGRRYIVDSLPGIATPSVRVSTNLGLLQITILADLTLPTTIPLRLESGGFV